MKLDSTLYILSTLATRIKWISDTDLATKIFKEDLRHIILPNDFFNKYPYSLAVSKNCQELQVIYACSFLDEYDRKFTPSRFPTEKERIIKFKRLVLPAYKRIKLWKDLKEYRNYVLAHNYRINDKSIFELKEKIVFNVPQTIEEYTLLSDLIFAIVENFKVVFPEIMDSFDYNKTLYDHIELQTAKTDTYLEWIAIGREIEQNKSLL